MISLKQKRQNYSKITLSNNLNLFLFKKAKMINFDCQPKISKPGDQINCAVESFVPICDNIYTYIINYQDNIVSSLKSINQSVSTTKLYAKRGTYNVTVTISNQSVSSNTVLTLDGRKFSKL